MPYTMNFDVIAATPQRNSNKLSAPKTEIRKIPKIVRKNSAIFELIINSITYSVYCVVQLVVTDFYVSLCSA